jgi:hypothetical protein
MPTIVPVDVGPKAAVNYVKIRLRYNTLAQMVSMFFASTFILGGILTFTVTKYDPKTDIVYRFYDKFNPCIFFDHYPANMVGILGIGVLALVHVIMVLIIWLRRCISIVDAPEHERPLSFLLLSACLGPILLGYLFFVNIFTNNLYDHDEAYTVHNISNFKGNISLLTRDEREGVTKRISDDVTWHSLWFVFYLVADLTLAAFIWSYASSLRANKKIWATVAPPTTSCRSHRCWRVARCVYCFLYFFGVIFFGLGVILMLYHAQNPLKGSEPGYRMGFGREYEAAPLLQRIVHWIIKETRVSLWSSLVIWIPGHAVFALPPSVGIDVSLSLSPTKKERSGTDKSGLYTSIDPTILLAGCVQVLALLILLTLNFEHLSSSAGGLRVRPWSLLFAPAWLSITAVTALSVYMSLHRLEIMTVVNNGITISLTRRRLGRIVGIALVTVMFLGMWIVIPDFSSAAAKWIGSLIAILLPLFVILVFDVHVDKKENKKDKAQVLIQRGYAILCLICGIISFFSIVGTVLLTVLMSCLHIVFKYHAPLPYLNLKIVPSTNGVHMEKGKVDAETGDDVLETVEF